MATRPERVAQNQARFRRINERRFGVLRFLPGAGVYVCECAREECTAPIRIRPDEYAAVRADPTRFFVLLDHLDPEVEVVVEAHAGWAVVEKIGEAGEVARKTAPPQEPE